MRPLKPFWRRTPPALFPSLLGFFGLALSWRAATDIWPVPAWIGTTFGLIATALLLITLTSYVVKLMIRPMVLWEDLKIGPARGSVSAGSMCSMTLAAFLVPYSHLGATAVWWMSIALHTVYFLCVVLILARMDRPLQQITPVLLLPFVGILVATAAAPAIGLGTYSAIILTVCIPLCAATILLSLWNGYTHGVPPAQRASYAILLAPPSVAAIGLYALSGDSYYLPAWICSTLIGVGLLPFLRWMGRGGWNPGWGAFTFPISSCAGVQIYAVKAGYGWFPELLAVITLTAATLLVPYIVIRTYASWMQGKLAAATNAAVA